MKNLMILTASVLLAFLMVACCDTTSNLSVTSNTVETSMATTSILNEQSEISLTSEVRQIIDSVTYRIIDCNGKPVVNAEVVIDPQNTSSETTASGFTNAQGEVTFGGVDSKYVNRTGEHVMKIRQYTLGGVRAIEKLFFELCERDVSEVFIINIQSARTYDGIYNSPNRVELTVVDEKNSPMENIYTSWQHMIPSIGPSIPYSHDEFDRDKVTSFNGYTNQDGKIAFVGNNKDELYSITCWVDSSVKNLEFHFPDGTVETVEVTKAQGYFGASPYIPVADFEGITEIKIVALR